MLCLRELKKKNGKKKSLFLFLKEDDIFCIVLRINFENIVFHHCSFEAFILQGWFYVEFLCQK